MSVPEPIAQGDLASKPFAHLLLYLEQRALSGTLAIWPAPGETGPAGQDRVLFHDGKPVAAKWRGAASALDKGLVELCARKGGPYAFYPADLVGSGAGVSAGRVDSHGLLAQSIRAGTVRDDAVDALLRGYGTAKVRLKVGVNLQRFQFVGKEDAFLQVLRAAPSSVDELARISGNGVLARRILYLLTITQCVEPYDGPVQPLKTGASGVMQSPMGGTAARAQALHTGTAARAQALGTGPGQRVPAGGGATSGVKPAAGAKPGAGAAGSATNVQAAGPARAANPSIPMGSLPAPQKFSAPPGPPNGLAPELIARWKLVTDRAQAIEKQNYFEMLGVAKDAALNQVSEAYLRAAKDWHPDRLPAQLAQLRPWSDRIFHYLTQAKEVLSDPEARAEHLKAVQSGGGTPDSERMVQAIVFSAVEYQKVEVLVRRREWDEALNILLRAREVNAGEADYFAMEAWILYNRHPDKNAPFPKMLAALDKALEMKEDHERANFYKGLVLKRMGEESKAQKFFKRALEINPRNIEAAREVRIASMRSEAPKKDGDLLSKFFNKKKS